MGSLDRAVKEKQLEKATSTFEAFKTSLLEQGLDEKVIGKNPQYRALQANVKKARARIKAIDASAAHVEAMKAKVTKAKADKSKKAAPKQGQGKKAAPKKKK